MMTLTPCVWSARGVPRGPAGASVDRDTGGRCRDRWSSRADAVCDKLAVDRRKCCQLVQVTVCVVVVVQHAAFHADKQVRRTTVILKVVSRPEEVKPGKTVTWTDEIRELPPVPPTRLGGGCKLIELKYLLTV